MVATQNGGPKESLIQRGEEYGILVDPDQPRDIARGLEQVLGERQVWEDLHQRCRQYVLQHYTWKRTAQDYLNLLEQIVAAPTARRPDDLLPIHPYFRDPRPEKDVSLQELSHLYFGSQSVTVGDDNEA